MQCIESEVTRTFLFALCREINPDLERDELLLEEVLCAHSVACVADLYGLGEEALSDMVRAVVKALPLAA